MSMPFTRLLRGLLALICLGSLSLMMAACFGIGDQPTSSTPAMTQSSASQSTSSQPSIPDKMMVTISERAGTHDIYSFAPATVTIKVGTTVQWVNNSDENHLLVSDASSAFSSSSMVPRSGSSDNTYQLAFTEPGTYRYTSKLVHRLNNQPEGVNSGATGTIIVTA